MENFQIRTNIITGSAQQVLQQWNIERLLVVSDPYFAQNGTAQRIAGGKVLEIFDGVQPDPTVELAARGAAVVQRFQPQVIVALGGGSAMDCAKAMAYFSGVEAKLVAIPTTSGSGSEVTDFAILTHDGVKHPVVDEKLRPDAAILDESLLEAMPPKLVAEGGFDLISHALEAIAATGAGKISDALAFDAFCTAVAYLPASFGGESRHRLQLHQAATMAGMAFSAAGLGLCHALSHSLGGAFHVPHGRLNAILLPGVLEYNSPAVMGKYAALARQAGLGSGSEVICLRGLKNALLRLRRSLQLPGSLAQAGVDPGLVRQQMESLVQATLADPCCKTNPVAVTAEGVRKLLWEVMGRG